MATPSPRGSSPASGRESQSPSEMTPRSKVKAMLASLDENSDDESISNNGLAKLKLSKSASLNNSTVAEKRSRINSINASEDDITFDDAPPRGELAAKMQAAKAIARSSSHDASPKVDTAKDRVEYSMVTASRTESLEDAAVVDNESEGDDDDEDIQAVVPKRKAPNPAESDAASSPHKIDGVEDTLFVSPATQRSRSPPSHDNSDFDEDLTANPQRNARFLALVEKKREERKAKEYEMEQQKAERAAAAAASRKSRASFSDEEDDSEISDVTVEKRLTKGTRPPRKASKKAIEEMHRETQRLSRNMQLAHEARTKKKITKESLFAKFNFRPAGSSQIEAATEQSRPASSSSAIPSDRDTGETPPTSPAVTVLRNEKFEAVVNDAQVDEDVDMRFSALEEMAKEKPSSVPQRRYTAAKKGKAKAIKESGFVNNEEGKESLDTQKRKKFRILPVKPTNKDTIVSLDSDSDLEVIGTSQLHGKKKDSVFDRVPVQQEKTSRAIQALRMLAHVGSPGKQPRKKDPKAVSAGELFQSLQKRAREQAKNEREERINDLRAKGIFVQTAEEREKQMAEVEDLIAKARQEGEEILRKEKSAARKERIAKGETVSNGQSSDDEEWDGELDNSETEDGSSDGEENRSIAHNDAVQISSDDEDSDQGSSVSDDSLEAVARYNAGVAFLEKEAGETDINSEESMSEEEGHDIDAGKDISDSDSNEELPAARRSRKPKNINVISDDEDEVVSQEKERVQLPLALKSPAADSTGTVSAPTTVYRSATKTFIPGVTVNGPAGMSLSQIFTGTMDESQLQPDETPTRSTAKDGARQDSLAFLRRFPAPSLPAFEPTQNDHSQDMTGDSQVLDTQNIVSQSQAFDSARIELQFSQSQINGFDSLVNRDGTQMSQMSQDMGFQERSPIKARYEDQRPSTSTSHMSQVRGLQNMSPLGSRHIIRQPSIDMVNTSQKKALQSMAPLQSQAIEPPPPTPFSQMSQDQGFQERSPFLSRFIDPPHSTVDTVILDPVQQSTLVEKSPNAKRRGKLRRRVRPVVSDEEDSAVEKESEDVGLTVNAFDVMRKAKRDNVTVVDDFDKRKSKARDMIHEQAEESEDEYAGLGGASDDESGEEEEDAYVKQIIDDAAGKDADQNELAALFADKDRANDAKQVEKLFKDITNGTLRRKRGADYDLSDSDDDGGEARRRMKRREFARMRKALLADERISKIAENPKKMAFLRAIEDREADDDEVDFLEDFVEAEDSNSSFANTAAGESQSQSQSQSQMRDNENDNDDNEADFQQEATRIPDSQPDTIMGPPKRKRAADGDGGDGGGHGFRRPPPHLRRTNDPAKRPSSLSEIRKSLSSLIEEPNSLRAAAAAAAAAGLDSDSDDDLHSTENSEGGKGLNSRDRAREKENRDPFARRRAASDVQVVDRISLKRASSSSLSGTGSSSSASASFTAGSNGGGGGARLAFAAPGASSSGFKVPPLLRRATTNSSSLSATTSATSNKASTSASAAVSLTERAAGEEAGGGGAIRKRAGKNSGVNFFARDSERRARAEKGVKMREEKRFRGAEKRRKVIGGLFGGKFE